MRNSDASSIVEVKQFSALIQVRKVQAVQQVKFIQPDKIFIRQQIKEFFKCTMSAHPFHLKATFDQGLYIMIGTLHKTDFIGSNPPVFIFFSFKANQIITGRGDIPFAAIAHQYVCPGRYSGVQSVIVEFHIEHYLT